MSSNMKNKKKMTVKKKAEYKKLQIMKDKKAKYLKVFRNDHKEILKYVKDDELHYYVINFQFCSPLSNLDNLECLFGDGDEISSFEKELIASINEKIGTSIQEIFLSTKPIVSKKITKESVSVDDLIDKLSVQTLQDTSEKIGKDSVDELIDKLSVQTLEDTILPSRNEKYFHDYPEYTELYVSYMKNNDKWKACMTGFKFANT